MDRIISVQKKSEEDYIIQFYLCLCKNDRSEIKRLLKHQKNRSYYERIEPLKKKISLDMQAKLCKSKEGKRQIQNNGSYQKTRTIKQKGRKVQNNGQ